MLQYDAHLPSTMHQLSLEKDQQSDHWKAESPSKKVKIYSHERKFSYF
jgi:hypothetical protein